jgi:general secretion pathway protein M
MRPLSYFEKRLLAILLLIAVLAGLAFAVAIPYRSMQRSYDEAIETRLDLLARYNRIAAIHDDVKRMITDVKSKDAKKFYLKSSAPALAAADIQQIVQTLVEVGGLQLDSMQIAPPKNEDGYRKNSLNLRLRGKLGGLQNMLYSLETTQPYLFVDNLSIQATVRQSAFGPYVPTPGVEPEVISQFDLSGYALVSKSRDVPTRH